MACASSLFRNKTCFSSRVWSIWETLPFEIPVTEVTWSSVKKKGWRVGRADGQVTLKTGCYFRPSRCFKLIGLYAGNRFKIISISFPSPFFLWRHVIFQSIRRSQLSIAWSLRCWRTEAFEWMHWSRASLRKLATWNSIKGSGTPINRLFSP